MRVALLLLCSSACQLPIPRPINTRQCQLPLELRPSANVPPGLLGSLCLAVDTWNEAAGQQPVFTIGPTVPESPQTIPQTNGVVGYLEDSEIPNRPGVYLAATDDGDLCISAVNVIITSDIASLSADAWQRAFEHALGHALGLPHLENGSLMRPEHLTGPLNQVEIDLLRQSYPFWR